MDVLTTSNGREAREPQAPIDKLPTEKFALSLGLPGAPKIKFLAKEVAKKMKNVNRVPELGCFVELQLLTKWVD